MLPKAQLRYSITFMIWLLRAQQVNSPVACKVALNIYTPWAALALATLVVNRLVRTLEAS